MAAKNSYSDYLKKEMNDLIDQLQMSELQKRFMKSRWLDQLLWLENRAERSRNRFHKLRITTIVGGIIIPALVSLNLSSKDGLASRAIYWSTFGISQMVAVSAALEEFFRYGDRWNQYRNTAEGLKIEGWQFFQLSGPYQTAQSHAEAYGNFADRVETIIRKDVDSYIAEALQQKKQKQEEKDKKEPEKPGKIASTTVPLD